MWLAKALFLFYLFIYYKRLFHSSPHMKIVKFVFCFLLYLILPQTSQRLTQRNLKCDRDVYNLSPPIKIFDYVLFIWSSVQRTTCMIWLSPSSFGVLGMKPMAWDFNCHTSCKPHRNTISASLVRWDWSSSKQLLSALLMFALCFVMCSLFYHLLIL